MFHRRTRSRVRAVTVATAAALAALVLGGCSGDSGDSAAEGGPSVVAPGKPGEDARTLSADEARKAVGDDTPNSADVGYVRMMIVHHRQALVMTDLAAKHAESDRVSGLARRIAAAQGPEIKAMEGWLKRHGKLGGGPKEHDHGAMPGMATPRQLEALSDARGAKFDSLFLKLMITHHQGAVTMATDVLSQGNNVLVEEMANDVIAQQTSEISRMRSLLA
ncbi:DUF305 domain-containing protein [Streptomyces meridianus]|uniref:DUF305 domain-containing protein n=1 Tax=Streptomyces meridianus TaxID=2938945 RepID=A0ABT0XBE0_9ACTN|nr:DUF305 domain-containing protein [Streptomyces meridianus]MCM2579816.1 DUF305 domain-containing protein [Streptomyces meridianus]